MSENYVLEELYKMLGPRAVLLPIPFREKGPVFSGWQSTTFEKTQEPDYQRGLRAAVDRGGNIGILLGGGLVSVDADTDGCMHALGINKRFSETLRTRGKRGCNFWFRMIGDYPNGQSVYKIKCEEKYIGEWRCGPGAQTVVWGEHPDSTTKKRIRYMTLVDKPVLTLAFSDLPWPAEFTLPWQKKSPAAAPSQSHSTGADLHKPISAYMAKVYPSIAKKRGDDQLFDAARALVINWGLSQEEALPYLRDFNARCEPPWPEARLTYKLKEADEKGKGERGRLRKDDRADFRSTGSSACGGDENVENVEIEEERIEFEEENSTNSTNSSGAHAQAAIFPQDSILKAFYDYAATITEGAASYIIGSILPVCAALLGRSVWLPWTSGSLHCNIFAACVGKPSDRKTTTIEISAKIARACLPNEAFIPKAFSPETLFDEYDTASGGQPDKLLIADDANAILTDWKRSGNGERNAVQFLDLYDCKHLSESYRRNRKKGSTDGQRRYVEFTSTSVVFGATFNICRFQNQVIQAGLQRRFLYYVAEGFGRTILYPKDDPETFKDLVEKFSLLKSFSGPFRLTTDARALFELFQKDNRVRHNNANPFDDALLCRLGSIPTATLKVAQIFEACRSVYAGTLGLMIQKETLQLAIDHVEECSVAAGRLEVISDRQNTFNDAEVLLATVRGEYIAIAKNGSIILSKTELTRRFAANGKRRGLTVDDLYLRLIPHLIQTKQAKALPKKGKLERYAFRMES